MLCADRGCAVEFVCCWGISVKEGAGRDSVLYDFGQYELVNYLFSLHFYGGNSAD